MSLTSAEDWDKWAVIFGRDVRPRYTRQQPFPFDPPTGRTAASAASEDRTGAADRGD